MLKFNSLIPEPRVSNKDIYTESSFSENYGWQMENVEVFEEPIEAKGKLSLWEYNTSE